MTNDKTSPVFPTFGVPPFGGFDDVDARPSRLKAELQTIAPLSFHHSLIRHLSLIRHSYFVIRHSPLGSRTCG